MLYLCRRLVLESAARSNIIVRCYRTKGRKNKKSLTASVNEPAKREASASGAWKRPATITHGSQHHEDLASFMKYAKREHLAETSTVYVGTRYEYTVSASLNRLGFDVLRTGKASDLGIDLLGWWHTPASSEPIKVLLQCKAHAKKLTPSNVRELEGSFPGAPPHWQGKGVMGFLVASSQATKGMRDALIKSSLPLGFMQVTREGKILQLLWNHQVSLWGLEGLGVTTKFSPEAGKDEVEQEVALTWNGRVFNMDMAAPTSTEKKSRTRKTPIAVEQPMAKASSTARPAKAATKPRSLRAKTVNALPKRGGKAVSGKKKKGG
jgi:hypothetical protein